jgi:hypothetical protein
MLTRMEYGPPAYPPLPRGPARPQRSVWLYLAIALAVLLALAGIAVVGAIALFFVGLSHYGSNK